MYIVIDLANWCSNYNIFGLCYHDNTHAHAHQWKVLSWKSDEFVSKLRVKT